MTDVNFCAGWKIVVGSVKLTFFMLQLELLVAALTADK